MINLLQETIDYIKAHKHSPEDVLWVGSNSVYTTWEEFSIVANIEYDNGYGGNEVPSDLMVVGQDWWLERGEYDGSEWWEYKTYPKKPTKKIRLKAVVRDQASLETYYSDEIGKMNK